MPNPEIAPALVERAIALVKRMADFMDGDSLRKDANALLAELPAPIDEDLLLAREVAADSIRHNSPRLASEIAAGHGDGYQPAKIALAAIRRVRQQEKG